MDACSVINGKRDDINNEILPGLTKSPDHFKDSIVKVKEEKLSCDESEDEQESIFLPIEFDSFIIKTETDGQNFEQEPHIIENIYVDIALPPKEKDAFQCKLCDFNSVYPSNLSRHKREVHSVQASKRGFQCSHCEGKFKRKHDLLKHIYRIHKIGKPLKPRNIAKLFYCPFCSFNSNARSERDKHKRHSHPEKIRWIHCPECEYKSVSRATVVIHLRNKHGIGAGGVVKQEVYFCDQCNFTTSYKKSFSDHMWALHDQLPFGVQPQEFVCHHCGYSTFRKTRIKRHIVSVHVSRRDFSTGLPLRRRFNRRVQIEEFKTCKLEYT